MASNCYEFRSGFSLTYWGISFGVAEKAPGCRYKWYASKFPRNELICEGFETREDCERAALEALRADTGGR